MTHPDDTDDAGLEGDGGLDAELRGLIDAERRRPGPPPGTAGRVQAAVLATVAATAASTAAASTAVTTAATVTTSAVSGSTFGTGAIVAAALAATVAGTVFVATADVDPPTPPSVDVVTTPTPPSPPAGLVVDAPVPTTEPPAHAAPVRSTARRPVVVVEAPTPAEEAARLAAEREVLGQARQALARDDVDGALGHLQRHRETWSRGHLVEEREALQVLALARGGDGRRREATDAATRFRATWPRSIFLDAIDRALR